MAGGTDSGGERVAATIAVMMTTIAIAIVAATAAAATAIHMEKYPGPGPNGLAKTPPMGTYKA